MKTIAALDLTRSTAAFWTRWRPGTRFVTADRKLYEKTRSLGLVELP